MMNQYTAAQLDRLPTLTVGQTCDLKIERDGVRVWLARTGPEDGEPCKRKVTHEVLRDGCWIVARTYSG